MIKITLHLCFALLVMLSSVAHAQKTLHIGVGNFPPFFIEHEQSGLFLEITKTIFAQLPDYSPSFIFMSNHRLLHEINSGKRLDVACNIFAGPDVKGYLSKPIFRYQDVAVTRKKDNFSIASVADLQSLSIAAYQGATELLGADYKAMAMTNANYSEHAHPKETTYLLVSGEKAVRVGDISIFLYDLKRKQYAKTTDMKQTDFTVHRIWQDVYSHMAFKDKALRDEVDSVITQLLENGVIDKIYQKYQQ
ncbi:substrate-binding periplasmic protein [Litorilituus sediminis]|uniref:Transporter substrate-binding domain-containing protein n=1 Tax=Litorilituus sediminis TaxID=718192 RepID=A0A4P6P9Y9_9GAMM|nr:transporter substrate-binding domain-containing protein [Litorilituus sediminis]QBG36385.1 transporter substrate-binding domain-containing protein [Litorilituus sediminis]